MELQRHTDLPIAITECCIFPPIKNYMSDTSWVFIVFEIATLHDSTLLRLVDAENRVFKTR